MYSEFTERLGLFRRTHPTQRFRHRDIALLATIGPSSGAQTSSPTHATQLPLSGYQQGGPSVQETAVPSASSSTNTVNTQVSVQGPYAGSVLDPNPPSGAVALSLREAIRRGLDFNLGKIGADAALQHAFAQHISARSSLLPTVSAALSENAAKVALAAEGFSANAFGATGFNFPSVVGPFHYYDARGTLKQSLFNTLGASSEESTWVITNYLVSTAIVLPMSGCLSNVIRRKRFYMMCVAMFTASSLLCAMAPTLPVLIFCRILQGAGTGSQRTGHSR